MDIREFLDQNMNNLTVEEYNAAFDDIEKMDRKSWVEKYAPLMEEKATGWNDLDVVKQSKPLPQRLREAFGSSDQKNVFDRPENFINELYYSDFEDVPREQFDEALAMMKKYVDEEKVAATKAGERRKREREVKNWGWRDIIASEYEKQRYIDDPESAIFGEKAPGFFGSSAGAKADLALGALGAAGDVAPGWWSMTGPAIRGVRDVGHIAFGSPYQKTKEQVLKDLAQDAVFNASTAWLPNFRKEKRMLEGSKGDVGKIISLEDEAKNINKNSVGVGRILSNPNLSTSDKVAEVQKYIENMPNSELKSKLLPYTNRRDLGLKDFDDILDISSEYYQWSEYAKSPASRNLFKETFSGNKNVEIPVGLDEMPVMKPVTEYTPFTKKILNAPELTKFEERVKKPMLKLASKGLTSENISNAAKNLGRTLPGRGKAPERVETPEDRELINQLKETEARFWLAGFKPRKIEGDPRWIAYQEWLEENSEE